MRDSNSSQNGHNRPDSRFRQYEKWQDIPVEVLRDFVSEIRDRYTDRAVAEMAELSMAAVQSFVKGRGRPKRRTLQALGELYMERRQLAFEWETVTERKALPQLRSVLPDGKDAALDYIDELFRVAEAAGTLSQSPDRLRDWLEFLVQAEYAIESPYEHLLRKRRPRGSADEPPKRTRKKRPDNDPG